MTSDKCILHPLMAWWAVLCMLSMIARHQPTEWAAHIDVDSSKNAVAIEQLLKKGYRNYSTTCPGGSPSGRDMTRVRSAHQFNMAPRVRWANV